MDFMDCIVNIMIHIIIMKMSIMVLFFDKNYKDNCPSNYEVCFEYSDICIECKKDCKLKDENLCECKNKSKKIVLAVVLVTVFLILIIP